ncbi:MAG: tRNA (N6-isopentenyl adenosine(37)-C2)-methylthiotransferase MiaB [Clostridia bacterium]|nr:tRNA (N6-isopentenyl adenosine(37)-C2)-methylthiotransferase MiaB [Clostridia bacterium]
MNLIKNYHIVTYGCQMNEHDTEVLSGILEQLGYQWTDRLDAADVLLLNTCCVREKAENKVIGHLGELKKLKQQNPDLVIGVCGCMAQQEGIAEKIRRQTPHVDLVFGTHNIHRLPELLALAREGNSTVIEIWEKEKGIVEAMPMKRAGGVKAYVTITYGCNNFCSYCIVPYVRGRERSRDPQAVYEEVKELAEKGFKEVMLLGQNVNSYGKDLANKVDFADLLRSLEDVQGLERIRYMTSHPRDFSDKLVETIKASRKVCEHFHLPIQSGSNAILKKMNRGYTREYYLELVQKIKEAVPKATLTTDIIVGFPGETEEDFQDTLDVVTKAEFDTAFTFLYSPRSGTPAAKWEQVPEEAKKERFQRLLELQNRISIAKNRQLLGQVEEVLVEGPSKTNEARLTGRTRGNKVVVLEGDESIIGKTVPVKIIEAQTWSLVGELNPLE